MIERLKKVGHDIEVTKIASSYLCWTVVKGVAEAANEGMGTVAGVAIPVLKGALAIYQVVQIRYIEEQRRAVLGTLNLPEMSSSCELIRSLSPA